MTPADTWKNQDDSFYIQIMSTSYMWFPMIGTMSTVIFGLLFSALSNALGWNQDGSVKVKCLSVPILKLWTAVFPNEIDRLVDFEQANETSTEVVAAFEKRRSTAAMSVR